LIRELQAVQERLTRAADLQGALKVREAVTAPKEGPPKPAVKKPVITAEYFIGSWESERAGPNWRCYITADGRVRSSAGSRGTWQLTEDGFFIT
jgi:hypothetical protein